jgi:hypothetical protein
MLAEIGNVRSVELLRPYVDHPTLGSSAIRAIKQLTGEPRRCHRVAGLGSGI